MNQDKIAGLFWDFGRAEEINRQNLQQILLDNRHTEYGRRMAFESIENVQAYVERIPLTVYEDYEGLCEPMRCTAYPVRYRLVTSGSTGTQKVFALTKEALNRYDSYICDMAYHHFGGRQGPHLHTSVFRLKEQGENLLSAAYYGWLKEEGLFDSSAYVGGEKLLFAEGIEDVFYVKTWLLLCCPALVSIQSIFLYDVLLIMQYLEKNWRSVLADMKVGRVYEISGIQGNRIGISGLAKQETGARIEEQLLACLPEDSVLAQVEKVLEEGFDTPILPRLFKDLRFISGIGGESMEFQTKALIRYSGDVPVCYFAYASSECMMGIAPYPGRAEYVLLPHSAYYEFLGEDGTWTQMSELVPGLCYEPVITTFSGLYRYRTGDMIRMCRYEGQAPVFEVVGRKQTMNIAGEKLREQLVRTAVAGWAKKVGIELSDFAVGIEQTVPGRYLVFVEIVKGTINDIDMMQEIWDDGLLAADALTGRRRNEMLRIIPENADTELDRIWQEMSVDYRDIRTLGMLRELKVIFCCPGHIAKAATGAGHRKHHTFLKEMQTERLLHKFR